MQFFTVTQIVLNHNISFVVTGVNISSINSFVDMSGTGTYKYFFECA